MKISVRAGVQLAVTFDEADWNYHGARKAGGAAAVIDHFKKVIGHFTRNPNGFDYDPATKAWLFIDSEQNRKMLEDIKRDYFTDPSQLQLF